MSRVLFEYLLPTIPSPHVFDGNLDKPQRTLIQEGILATLAPLKRPNGYLLDVKSTATVVHSYTDFDNIAQLLTEINRTPVIAVATSTRTFEITGIGGKEAQSEIEILLYFATQNTRNLYDGRMASDVAAQRSRHPDPGLHVIMQHALELLLGTYPAVTTSKIKQLRPSREEELVTDESITIWLQTWHTRAFSAAFGAEWRTADQLLDAIRWRTTTSTSEANRPALAAVSTSLDADTDDLGG
jgi:hypothetical protein